MTGREKIVMGMSKREKKGFRYTYNIYIDSRSSSCIYCMYCTFVACSNVVVVVDVSIVQIFSPSLGLQWTVDATNHASFAKACDG